MSRNEGWVSVGIDHDTAQFAAQAIGRWWQKMGSERYPHAERVVDHSRRRRQQWQPVPSVEGRIAGFGGPPEPAHPCVPLPAGHQQVEQDRASNVLLTSPRTGAADRW